MTIKSRAVTVATTATALDSATETDSWTGSSATVYNDSAVTVYIGGADVTVANGAPVAPGAYGPALDLQDEERLYGIVATGTASVRVLERGV